MRQQASTASIAPARPGPAHGAPAATPAPGSPGQNRLPSRPAGLAGWAALLVVWVVWGSTYLAIRVADQSIPPFPMAAVRYLIAGALLYPIARLSGGRPLRSSDRPRLPQWAGMAVVGTMLLAFGNGEIGRAHV